MTLLPDHHPQPDFFILDISDVVPKDDTASMEHPLFSLATKPDMRHLVYQSGENRLEIIPSTLGLPTIKDKDVLIFCISQLMHRKNRGEQIGKTVRFSARELMIATNRTTDGREYKRIERAFQRLQGTQFKTTIRTGGKKEVKIFSLVDEAGYVMQEHGEWRLDYCEVKLSNWFMRAIEANEVVTITREYFRLRRPLERRLYEIARKHCGEQKKWQIGLAKLQEKTGSNAPLKRFRLNIREIIANDHIPFYRLELTKDDLVIVRPRKQSKTLGGGIILQQWAIDKGREYAAHAALDFYALEAEWLSYANDQAAKGNPPEKPSAAFVAFCKIKCGIA